MKCPYQTKIIHKPEYTDGYIKHFAEDITEFCDCVQDECPFYYETWEHKPMKHCKKVESEGKA